MTPTQLSQAVLRSVRGAVASGELRVAVPEGPDGVALRRPPRHVGAHAWSTGIALRLAGPAGLPAAEVAGRLRARLAAEPGVAEVRVTGGGFLTIALAADAEPALLRALLAAPPAPSLPDDPALDAARWAAVAGGDPAGGLLVQRVSNPLFLVRYARSRCAALARGAAALGVVPDPDAAPFELPAERELLAALRDAGRPAVRLPSIAEALLTVEALRPTLPTGDEKPGAVHRARLALAQATGTVLADGLHDLGVSAPEWL
ncbi:arginine--tRNA ligase [Streptomyces sp. DSM 44915]|uniref:Arginine--tRNA ligase n=1 Tax=Streptomyces chisholmiae TaxID=3075540 RepID=A0ABU2JZQ0_9ACTN|nr:arginine--tRNA ligase [Streptomyces sp. DSM 44915]MDT0270019.1 arginine--tRNA ligase [Streptomyces sp. DSM 44915]